MVRVEHLFFFNIGSELPGIRWQIIGGQGTERMGETRMHGGKNERKEKKDMFTDMDEARTKK